jgi:hypothetical protein
MIGTYKENGVESLWKMACLFWKRAPRERKWSTYPSATALCESGEVLIKRAQHYGTYNRTVKERL